MLILFFLLLKLHILFLVQYLSNPYTFGRFKQVCFNEYFVNSYFKDDIISIISVKSFWIKNKISHKITNIYLIYYPYINICIDGSCFFEILIIILKKCQICMRINKTVTKVLIDYN